MNAERGGLRPCIPYYADDTEGVHFEVRVGNAYVQAYISHRALSQLCGLLAPGDDCVAAYVSNREAIDAAVNRRVRTKGPETVLVQVSEVLGDTDAAN